MAAYFTAKQHPDVAMYSEPTFIVTGDHDKLTAPRTGDDMKWLIPAVNSGVVAPTGHPGFLELSVEYDQTIANFVRRIASST